MYYVLIPLRITRLPSRLFVSFYIFSLFPRTYISTFFSPVFTFSFPFYIFLVITSYITFYLIFYLILLFSARLATPRTPRSPYFSYLLILMFHTCILFLYIFIHSLSPPFSTSVSLSFISFSLSFLFISFPPLFSFACASFSSDPFYFRYPFFASSFLIQYFSYPFPPF